MEIDNSIVFRLAIGIAAVMALIRYRRSDPCFYPFFIFLWIGLIHVLGNGMLMICGYFTSWNDNVLYLFSVVVGIWQFWEWGLWKERSGYFLWLLTFLGLFWLVETCLRLEGSEVNSYFLIVSSLCLVLMSVRWIAGRLYTEYEYLHRDPVFMICFGFIIHFSVFILVESSWISRMNEEPGFRRIIYNVMAWVHIVTGILFAMAVRWVPVRKECLWKS